MIENEVGEKGKNELGFSIEVNRLIGQE